MNAAAMNAAATDASMPRTIGEYLEAVRIELRDADPAVIHDALHDAEEYLRSEMAEHPELDEATIIRRVASSYGAPAEVAEIYRDTETQVSKALRQPAAPPRRTLAGRFFGVAADPRTYASLFYMLLSLATGIFYFTWAVTGLSLSAGLMILIIGLPFAVLFLGTVRVLSLVEGRIVETMLGERMPRRPLYAARGKTFRERIVAMVTDGRTWSTLLYMVLMLPLGVVYFTVSVAGLATSFGLIAAPVASLFVDDVRVDFDFGVLPPAIALPLSMLAGVVLLFAVLHLARGIGRMHAQLAKNLLVKSAQY